MLKMSHEFSIKALDSGKIAYFDGYCNGIMYISFGAMEHNCGCSGDGKSVKINRATALVGMLQAIEFFNHSGYPDPSRMDAIKKFFNEVLNGTLMIEDEFEIRFY